EKAPPGEKRRGPPSPAAGTAPPNLANRERHPQPLQPALLGGDRDWVLFVEGRPDAVVLYPSRRQFLAHPPTTPQGRADLLRAAQQLLERRQAAARAADAVFRPQVRFLVHPDGVRTFHLSYPVLDPLPTPKTRQELQPEDDIERITAGY